MPATRLTPHTRPAGHTLRRQLDLWQNHGLRCERRHVLSHDEGGSEAFCRARYDHGRHRGQPERRVVRAAVSRSAHATDRASREAAAWAAVPCPTRLFGGYRDKYESARDTNTLRSDRIRRLYDLPCLRSYRILYDRLYIMQNSPSRHDTSDSDRCVVKYDTAPAEHTRQPAQRRARRRRVRHGARR